MTVRQLMDALNQCPFDAEIWPNTTLVALSNDKDGEPVVVLSGNHKFIDLHKLKVIKEVK